MKKILSVVGARPQFIKHCAFENAMRDSFQLVTIHTGQHYDSNMSSIFFGELEMSEPDYQLSVGSASHGAQTGKMMEEIEKVVLQEKPDYVNLYGDTNSTLAGALCAAKLHVPVIHIEAGLRSWNREMPEEINRIVTDHVSSYLFAPNEAAQYNLTKEGITDGVYVVGDVMKDLVLSLRDKTTRTRDGVYYYATIHRPYNTDSSERLQYILESLNELGATVVFPVHPRTNNAAKVAGLDIASYRNIVQIEPVGYATNLSYLKHAKGLITDSGGMQKEAYWLQVPCVTIRKETEWTETLTQGANTLLFDQLSGLRDILEQTPRKFDEDLYGQGDACRRIKEVLLDT